MSKLGNIKKFIPLVVFMATIGLGAVSIATSYRLQKAKQVTPKEAAASPEDCPPGDTACELNEWVSENPQERCQDDPWCCQDGGGGSDYESTQLRVYCQDPGGPQLPINDVTISTKTLRAYQAGCNNCNDDWERGCYDCNYKTANLTSDDNGTAYLAYPIKTGYNSWNNYFEFVKITQLPEEFTFTLNSSVTLADGRQIPAGTYTVPTSQLAGPEYPSCGQCQGWYQGDCGKCPERHYECQSPSCQSDSYNCCGVEGTFEFKYLNCFPEITTTPTPTPGPTATPTPTPEAQCERCRVYDEDWNLITDLSTLQIGDSIYFATLGSTTDPAGITKARFMINSSASSSWCSGSGLDIVDGWCETTLQHGQEFYVPYTISSAGAYTVASMVYNPNLGWF